MANGTHRMKFRSPSRKRHMSKQIRTMALICLLGGAAMFGQSCAYYNTFYNAKKYYETGERANRNRPTGQSRDVQNYKKCIETGSRLLELYPKSRWVDDCLLLMGKAYYRSGEFPRAQRKFEELLSNFPKSKLVPETRLWLAETLIEMKRPAEALSMLEQLRASPAAKAFWARASYRMGRIHFDAKRYGDAATAYQNASERFRERSDRADALFMYGRSLFLQNDFQAAKAVFERVPKLKPSRELIYLATVELGRCKAELGDTQGALELLHHLRGDIQFQSYSSGIELTLAKIASDQGDYEEATRTYQDYLQTNASDTGKAEAFFRLGVIYRDDYCDLHQAAAYFDSVPIAKSAGTLADSARAEAQKLRRGLSYLQKWLDAEAELQSMDSLLSRPPSETGNPRQPVQTEAPDSIRQASSDSVQGSPLLDSIAVTQVPPDTLPAPLPATGRRPTPEEYHAARGELQRALFQVGEFFWHDLGRSDSAFYFFQRAAPDTFDSAIRWKANLVLADMARERGASFENLRPYYEAVLQTQDVPVEAENVARRALGLPLKSGPTDTLRAKYLELEGSLLDTTKHPDSLLAALQQLLS
ncbi:MAG: tetratricopeptide repeat protein, partial [Calditrichaeota bacterium]|nr:tetratricopeptide repeat protein [Calditrichota bacterium]